MACRPDDTFFFHRIDISYQCIYKIPDPSPHTLF
jgi:hypothetical protein